MERKRQVGRTSVLLALARSPAYLAVVAGSSLIYFLVVYSLITASNLGIFLTTVPIYLIYLMVGSAGVLLGLSVLSVKTALIGRAYAAGEGILSAVLPAAGGLVATCACSYSVLAAALAVAGINAFEISGIVSWISLYQSWLILAIIAVNVLLIFYYSGKVAGAVNRLHPQRREMLGQTF
ncbi:MAG: hypothetical protein QXF01_02455 [Candidatus Micrarchaeaceae archaeon]